jgi:Kef-type K+ transport system membrane component KefB
VDATVTSLFWISLVAVAAPLLAGLVPRRLVSEVVLLLALGIVIGPYGLELATIDAPVDLLRELGLAFLFLLAGFEVELRELTGRDGGVAALTWLGCLLLALGVVALLGVTEVLDAEIAVAIALTSTALGTLLPILKDHRLLKSPIGVRVLRHGAYGELGPVIAIAVLLGTRGPFASLLVLSAFLLLALGLALLSRRMRPETSALRRRIDAGAETTGQTPLRLVVLLLASLIAVAEVFELDIVLAAFAAGFILRMAIPEGNHLLETKIEGMAFGMLVPLFFVTSGMGVDPEAIASRPGAFVIVVALILAVRGFPVFLVTRIHRPALRTPDSAVVGFYAATGLPIIVAVTAVAVKAGEMSDDNASLLIGAGAATVLLYPLAAVLVLGRTNKNVDTGTGSSPNTQPS